MIWLSESGRGFIQTAAHCVGKYIADQDRFVYYKNIWAYRARIGEDTYLARYKIKQCHIHPEYKGGPDSGFDMAILVIEENDGPKNNSDENYAYGPPVVDCIVATIYPHEEDRLVESLCSIGGYPYEKNFTMWSHAAQIESIRQGTEEGKCLYYPICTTPGQSGSPIIITEPSFVTLVKKRLGIDDSNVKGIIVGVHTKGFKIGATEELNCGTLFTENIKQWRTSILDTHFSG